jgi:hypothetical protein
MPLSLSGVATPSSTTRRLVLMDANDVGGSNSLLHTNGSMNDVLAANDNGGK